MPYPYPDEPTWWAEFEADVTALYVEVGRPYPDPGDVEALRWHARTAYDIGAGMEPDTSKRKHLRELRETLGLPFEPPAGGLVRRVIDGQFFRLETGEPWTWIQCSDFNLLGRYLAHEDIRPVLAQRRDVGFNTLRVFTAYDVPRIGTLMPSPAFYGVIPDYLTLCASYGLYNELVAFTGPYGGLFEDDDAKVDHWLALQRACSVADACDPLLELVNEGDHEANRDIPFNRLQSVFGILSSHGSAMADRPPMLPVWDYSSYHSNDLFEWQRKCAHNGMEDIANQHGCPAVSGENTRMPDNDGNPHHAFDAAAGAALLSAGSCFHSPHGKTSELWDGLELECAVAWVQGARSVPLEFQRGAYHHRTDLEGPGVIRAYDRRLSDGRAFTIMIRA